MLGWPMKIATFNINDVNKRLANLIGWLRAEKPDVVALQELKAADREFPKAAIEKAGLQSNRELSRRPWPLIDSPSKAPSISDLP